MMSNRFLLDSNIFILLFNNRLLGANGGPCSPYDYDYSHIIA